jgi:hypothetical protein
LVHAALAALFAGARMAIDRVLADDLSRIAAVVARVRGIVAPDPHDSAHHAPDRDNRLAAMVQLRDLIRMGASGRSRGRNRTGARCSSCRG